MRTSSFIKWIVMQYYRLFFRPLHKKGHVAFFSCKNYILVFRREKNPNVSFTHRIKGFRRFSPLWNHVLFAGSLQFGFLNGTMVWNDKIQEMIGDTGLFQTLEFLHDFSRNRKLISLGSSGVFKAGSAQEAMLTSPTQN